MAKKRTAAPKRIENPKTGKEILQYAQQAIQDKARDKLKNLFLKIATKIQQRELWIANRQHQIKRLKATQDQLIKLFDQGRLDDETIQALEVKLAKIDDERVGRHRFVDEEDDDPFV